MNQQPQQPQQLQQPAAVQLIQCNQELRHLHLLISDNIIYIILSDNENYQQAYGQFCNDSGFVQQNISRHIRVNSNAWNRIIYEMVLEMLNRNPQVRNYRSRVDSFLCNNNTTFDDVAQYLSNILNPTGIQVIL